VECLLHLLSGPRPEMGGFSLGGSSDWPPACGGLKKSAIAPLRLRGRALIAVPSSNARSLLGVRTECGPLNEIHDGMASIELLSRWLGESSGDCLVPREDWDSREGVRRDRAGVAVDANRDELVA
jgi:hypothetical protein